MNSRAPPELAPNSATPGLVWPALPSAAAQAMLATQFQFDLTQWWSAEALRDHQFLQLRRLLAHAVKHVPYYRRLAISGRLPRTDDVDPGSFMAWPLLDKSQLQQDSPASISESIPPGHGGISWGSTSGSTGQPLRFAYTDLVVYFQHALLLRGQLWYELDLRAKYAAIRVSTPTADFSDWGPPTSAVWSTGPAMTTSALEDHKTQLEWLCRHAPTYVLAHNTNLRALLTKSAHYGLVPRGVRAVFGFGDMKSPDMRELALTTWGARYYDNYSCSEIGTLALQCPLHEHMHVQSERVILEVLRPDGSACGPGEPGRVVVTDLHNFAMPLIRYQLGDIAVLGEPCACGRGLPVIRQIVGRAGQLAVDPTGRTFYPHLNMEFWVTAAPILQRQLVQVAIDAIEVRYVADRDLEPDEIDRLGDAICKAMRYPYRISFVRLAGIEHAPGGKFDDFIAMPQAAGPASG